jgi:hypothetical protein
MIGLLGLDPGKMDPMILLSSTGEERGLQLLFLKTWLCHGGSMTGLLVMVCGEEALILKRHTEFASFSEPTVERIIKQILKCDVYIYLV